MKARILVVLASLLAIAGSDYSQQIDSSIHANTYPGPDVGSKVTKAMVNCPQATIPCVIVLDPSLSGWPAGTMPTLPSNVIVRDYRNGGPALLYGATPTLFPWISVDTFFSNADGFNGQDAGYALQAACNEAANNPLGLAAVQMSSLKTYKWYTTANISVPCVILAYGAQGVAMPGGAGGVWGATPITVTGATLNAGSQTITFPSTSGLGKDFVIGDGNRTIPNGAYITSVTGTTSATISLPAQLTMTGIPSTGTNQLCAVNHLRGLATGQYFSLPSTPAGSAAAWAWQGGGTYAQLTAINQATRCLTFSANINVTTGNHLNQPITLTAESAAATLTTNFTAHAVAPMIRFLNTAKLSPNPTVNFEGFQLRSGVYGLWIHDYYFLNPYGRYVTGVQGIQGLAQDGWTLKDVRIDQLAGAGIIAGGDDYGQYCVGSTYPVGGVRESMWSGDTIADSGEWQTGQPQLLIASPYCNNSANADESNQISMHGMKFISGWGPNIVATSYNPKVWSGAILQLRQIECFGCQFEGASRTAPGTPAGGNIPVPTPNLDLQWAQQFYISGEIAVSAFGSELISVGNVGSLTVDSYFIGQSGHTGAFTCNSSGGSTLTCSTPLDSSGAWDDQCGILYANSTSYSACAIPVGAVNSAGTQITLTTSIPSATNGNLVWGNGGYGINIKGSLGLLLVPNRDVQAADSVSAGVLYPSLVSYARNLFAVGSCPGVSDVAFLGERNSQFCAYGQVDSNWSQASPAVNLELDPNIPPGGYGYRAIGVSDTATDAAHFGFYNVGAGSPNNCAVVGMGLLWDMNFCQGGKTTTYGGSTLDDGNGNAAIAGAVGGASTVTLTPGTGAGSGGTVTCDTTDGYACNNVSGVVTLATGTGTPAGDLFTVSWTKAGPHLPRCAFTANGTNTASATTVYQDTANSSTTKCTMAVTTNVTASSTYKIGYSIQF